MWASYIIEAAKRNPPNAAAAVHTGANRSRRSIAGHWPHPGRGQLFAFMPSAAGRLPTGGRIEYPHRVMIPMNELLRIRRGLLVSGLSLAFSLAVCAAFPARAQQMPQPAPIPDVPAVRPPDSLAMQDPAGFAEVKMDFPIAAGPLD